MELFRLFGSILIDDKEAIESLKNADQKGKETSESMGKKFGNAAKTVGKGMLAVGTATVGAIGALTGMATKTAQTTDRIDKMSQKIGLSREGFQEWDFIMSQSGMSVEQLQMGFKTMVNAVDQAIDGTGKGAESFERLGISVHDANGQVKDQETIFNEAVIALQGMEEGTEKAKLANDLFGRSGAEMMPLLNGAVGSVEEMKQKAHELGLVLDDETIDAGVVFTDTMDQAQRSLSTIVTKVGAEVMPIIQTMLEWVIANMPTIQSVMSTVFGFIGGAVNTVISGFQDYLLPAFQTFYDWIQGNMPVIKQFISDTFKKAKEMIDGAKDAFLTITEFIKEHWAVFEPILAGVAGAIVVYKLVAVAMGIWTAATTLWTTVTTIATTVAGAFSAAIAFLTSPIGIAIVAIGAMIAIGVALYRNWDTVKVKANELWSVIKTKFNQIKEAISGPINAAKDAVKNAIDKIKGFFNFTFSWPKIPMPSFGVSPSGWKIGDLLKGSIPKLAINWNAKGGIFDEPTIFNTSRGLQGVGEAGPEAILPLNKETYSGMAEGIVEAMSRMTANNSEARDNRPVILQVDGKTFAQIIGDYTDNVDGSRIRTVARGLA